jgi:hypothetical protein
MHDAGTPPPTPQSIALGVSDSKDQESDTGNPSPTIDADAPTEHDY